MKISIKPLFGKIKGFVSEYTKAFTSILGGFISIIISAILQFHTLWQLNMMQNDFIWGSCETNIEYFQSLIKQGYTSVQYIPFQDGFLFQMRFGDANDIFLSLNTIGWTLAIVGTFLIMLGVVLFYRANMIEREKLIQNRNL